LLLLSIVSLKILISSKRNATPLLSITIDIIVLYIRASIIRYSYLYYYSIIVVLDIVFTFVIISYVIGVYLSRIYYVSLGNSY